MDTSNFKWLSKNRILHSDHPRLNSITLCGRNWFGWYYGHTDGSARLCKNCVRMSEKQLENLGE